MDILLNDIEARILGSLLEKSMTTPEYYPLTLNALTSACNQKSNRHPVVSFDEPTIYRGIDSMKEKQLVVQSDAGRVPKYSENFAARQNLLDKETALLTVLLLRGPQTAGELRGRTERMYAFADLEETEETLVELGENNYVVKLPRQPGRKEPRWAHLLCGEIDISEEAQTARPEPAALIVKAENERITALEEEVRELKSLVEALAQELHAFKSEFQ